MHRITPVKFNHTKDHDTCQNSGSSYRAYLDAANDECSYGSRRMPDGGMDSNRLRHTCHRGPPFVAFGFGLLFVAEEWPAPH